MTSKQLQNSILQMAVQGKLVPQNPNDEPASVLLEQIRREREQLAKTGKIKKPKSESVILRGSDKIPSTQPGRFYEKIGNGKPIDITDELPFEIPESWEWVRLGEVYILKSGKFISPKNINAVSQDYLYPCFGANGLRGYVKDYNCDDSVFIIGRVGSCGKINKVKGKAYITDNAIIAKPLIYPCLELLQFFLSPEKLASYSNASVQPVIASSQISKLLIPLPPLAEQKRIAAKLEEILPKVEEYKNAEEGISQLDKTFPASFKKSILHSAVKGQLVLQDPNDEPASILLEKIHKEKLKLINERKIKKPKTESFIYRRGGSWWEKSGKTEKCIDAEIPFEIPDSWEWVRLGNILISLTDGTHTTPKYVCSGIPFLSVKNLSSGEINFTNCKYITEAEHKALYRRCNPEFGDILLTKVGTTGIPVIVETNLKFSLFVSVALLKFNQNLVYNHYLQLILKSPAVQEQVRTNTKGVGNKNWVIRDIANTLLPLPPLAEQKRIAEKIEQYMGINKKLEAALAG